MAKGTHIIHRLVLNIEVSGRGAAKNAEKAVMSYFEHVLLKRIEDILDSIDTKEHLLIDKLDLDLGKLTLKGDVPEGLEEKFTEAFHSATLGLAEPRQHADDVSFKRLSQPQKAFQTFAYFLKNGRLPWYALSVMQNEEAWLDEIYRALKEDFAAKNEVLKIIREPKFLGRLFVQFNRNAIKKLTALLLDLDTADVDLVIDQQVKLYIADNPITTAGAFAFFETMILLIYLRSANKRIFASPSLQRQLKYIANQSANSIVDDVNIVDKLLSPEIKNSEDNSNDNKTADEQNAEADGLFVSQAGLVILHPFLEYFFKDFELIQDDDFVDMPARQLGVHLLHYLATGQVNAFEYDLYFEKFFCCWPADSVIEREVDIPQLMCDEADNMLLAVIKHWKALKNTSPGGLREGFLIRDGKLIERENPVRLIIGKKDMDVLLATLPWGIGVVKLPWMREPFYVEWQ